LPCGFGSFDAAIGSSDEVIDHCNWNVEHEVNPRNGTWFAGIICDNESIFAKERRMEGYIPRFCPGGDQIKVI
jgi:hypothetical protein